MAAVAVCVSIVTLQFSIVFPRYIAIISLLSILSVVGFYFTFSTSVSLSISVLASVSLSFICAAVLAVFYKLYYALEQLRLEHEATQSRLNAIQTQRNAARVALRIALAAATAQRPARQPQNNNTTNDPR